MFGHKKIPKDILQNEFVPQMKEDLMITLGEDFMVSIDKRDSQTIRLMPDEYRIKQLKEDYEKMSEIFFVNRQVLRK